jgi:hypothetical protein
MADKPDSIMCLVLNVLASLALFLIANVANVAIFTCRPMQITLVKGPLWPVDLLLGHTFPMLLAIIGIIFGAITAFQYRSRWGAATASALATLALLHWFVAICLRQ